MGKHLKVTQGDKTPYGWVYFSDDTRIGFASAGIPRGSGRPHNMFEGNWGDNTEQHFILAQRWLEENNPNCATDNEAETAAAVEAHDLSTGH